MKAIIACDPKGGIGYEGGLPWTKLQGDLPRFKTLTLNQVVVMGKNTWYSLPKRPLPDRLNIVLSRQQIHLPGAIVANNIDQFKHFHAAWIIGGAQLFESCWELIDTIHLSRTHIEYPHSDTFIDLQKLEDEFELVDMEECRDHNYEIWKVK